jgi:hypothetical protein
MKKTILLLLTVTLLSFIPTKNKNTEEKKYTVSLTINEWQSKLDLLNYVSAAIKQSDLPTKVSLPILDSLSKFTQTLVNQLNKQLIDTTKKK